MTRWCLWRLNCKHRGEVLHDPLGSVLIGRPSCGVDIIATAQGVVEPLPGLDLPTRADRWDSGWRLGGSPAPHPLHLDKQSSRTVFMYAETTCNLDRGIPATLTVLVTPAPNTPGTTFVAVYAETTCNLDRGIPAALTVLVTPAVATF